MRIAVWHNLPSGGSKRALHDHVRGLVARGHKVQAWCPPTADSNYLPLGDLVHEKVLPLDWPRKPRLNDYWPTTLKVQQSLAAMAAHCRLCAAEINQGSFDILFANTCRMFHAPLIGRYVTIPSVLYLGEPCRWLYEAEPRQSCAALSARPEHTRPRSAIREWGSALSHSQRILNDRLRAREEANSAAAFTRILVNSLYSRESVLRAYGLDSDVCYLGIDSDLFRDRELQREDYVVGLGSFISTKNIKFAIEAIAGMAAPRPKLVWVGNAVFDRGYLDEMVTLAVTKNVEFLPQVNVSDDMLVDILNRASVMIYAPRLEPFGLAPLEAGACGVPVVAVAEGGVRETVVDGETGLLVRSDPAEAGAALSRLRSDPAFARRLGANARMAVKEKWSLEGSTDRIEGHLRKYII